MASVSVVCICSCVFVFVYLNLSPAVGCGSAIPDITDIKYDLPVCHEVYDGHIYINIYIYIYFNIYIYIFTFIYIYIYIYFYKLTERPVVLLNAIFDLFPTLNSCTLALVFIFFQWEIGHGNHQLLNWPR